jgi:hypothetical protein
MPPSTDWKEVVPKGEAERFAAYAKKLRDLQAARAKGGSVDRGLHAKPVAGLAAELNVSADLPDHARHGLFATPKRYEAYVRLSNGGGHRGPDSKSDVRGFAIKVLGVPGKKIIEGMEDAKTQDFLLIASHTPPFRHTDEFVALVLAAENPLLLLPRLIGALGFGRAFGLLKSFAAGVKRPFHSFATSPFYTAAPLRYGPYAARLAIFPREEAVPTVVDDPEFFHKDIAARLAKGPIPFDVRVQFFVDESKTPIEDLSKGWDEGAAPFATVATLTLLQQNIDDERGRRIAERVEGFSFDPWHALEEHRPLGNFMRARNHAYRESSILRNASPEPTAATVD